SVCADVRDTKSRCRDTSTIQRAVKFPLRAGGRSAMRDLRADWKNAVFSSSVSGLTRTDGISWLTFSPNRAFARPVGRIGMKLRTLLICAVALAALALGVAMSPVVRTQSASLPATISVQELHRQVDVKSLPELKIEDFQP